MPDFEDLVQQDPFPLSKGNVTWRTLTTDHVSTLNVDGREFLKVDPAGLELLASEAFHDLAHFLRKDHLQQLADILKDDEASENDRFVKMLMFSTMFRSWRLTAFFLFDQKCVPRLQACRRRFPPSKQNTFCGWRLAAGACYFCSKTRFEA